MFADRSNLSVIRTQKTMKTNKNVALTAAILFVSMLNFIYAQSPSTMTERIALFDYDKNVAFDTKVVGIEKRGSITIKDISFVGISGQEPIKAFLVIPEGSDACAGILWGHWLGHHTSNRDQYLVEAVELASKGVVSLLVDAMWSKPGWYENRTPEDDYENSIKQVIEFRRAMDLLLSQKKVDPNRIGFVGHDYSGMYGSIAAGIEARAKTYVFVAVTSSLYDWAFFSNQPKSKVEYVQKNAVFELTDFISRIEGSVFCQFANDDPFISKTDGNVFFNAVKSKCKEKKRYDAGHFMKGEHIRADRIAWLIKELELTK